MHIKNINRTIYDNGNTSDIINVVMMAYDIENDSQIEVLAKQLQGETDLETCYNIWKYLIDNVTYRADSGVQEIKSPARLINDRSGDCKSYSLFTAVVLRYLGIQHVFRFVSYDTRKEATHVYVVANAQGSTLNAIIIDAVAYVQAGYPFNKELKYTYHCDMADKGTKIAYLAGLPKFKNYRKKIGNTNTIPDQSTDRYKVWIGDENEANITPGKHYLYALFDLNSEMCNIAKNDVDRAYYFDQMDMVASLLHCYNYVNGNCQEFRRMAFIVCGMISEGLFKSSETNEDNRADKLDDLFLIIDERYNNGYFPPLYDRPTWDMITHEVYAQNVIIGSTPRIGQTEYDVISKVKESGIYYIYTFLDSTGRSKAPSIVSKKLDAQNQTLAWVSEVNTYQSPSGTSLTIRSGIVARTGSTPEQYLSDLQAGKAHDIHIGDPITLTTIVAVISIITGIIAIFKALFPAKATAPKPADSVITGGAFDPNTDYSKIGTTTTSSLSSIGLPLALGAVGLWFMSRKKSKK